MRIVRSIVTAFFVTMLVFGIPLVTGGCGGNAPPPMPTASPYEQAKQSFDAYKEEMMKRKTGRAGTTGPPKR